MDAHGSRTPLEYVQGKVAGTMSSRFGRDTCRFLSSTGVDKMVCWDFFVKRYVVYSVLFYCLGFFPGPVPLLRHGSL